MSDDGKTLWHGRFAGGPAEALMAYTVSLPFDRQMWRDDLAGSAAHVRGLARVGLLSADERDAILAALDDVGAEMESGEFVFLASDEDIHTAVERRVTELAGPAGGKLHTARSRNDQVATDLRLWCKRELLGVAAAIHDLQVVLLERALEVGDVYLPGYTHLQRAQPVLLTTCGHGWALARDVDRLLATRTRLDVSPLGAGALAGSSLPIDPVGTAADLGFAGGSTTASMPSAIAISSRKRCSIWRWPGSTCRESARNGCCGRPGSSVPKLDEGMHRVVDAAAEEEPRHRGAARGKSGRLIGNLTGLLTTLKGLPLAYNRDLQEDKEPLFDSVEQVLLAVAASPG